MDSDWQGFEAGFIEVNGQRLFVRHGGVAGAPAVLLLHGYPQTHAMWRRIALPLAERFAVVVPDLRGYGRSSKPEGGTDHSAYAKRAMAADAAALMTALGHTHFAVVGHDRGGRVAHRLALDHAARVPRLAMLDIAPTLTMYEQTSLDFARAYYHWFHLIQPAPLPERHIGADPLWHLHYVLSAWGNGTLAIFEPAALADYEAAFVQPETIHATCEDYRAAAGIDLDHDRASRAAGLRLQCPLHVLWGERGVVNRLFRPLDDWRAVSDAPVTGAVLPGGHFMAEEHAAPTLDELTRFLTG